MTYLVLHSFFSLRGLYDILSMSFIFGLRGPILHTQNVIHFYPTGAYMMYWVTSKFYEIFIQALGALENNFYLHLRFIGSLLTDF